MTKILETKVGRAYVTDDGQHVGPHELYRYVDENGDGGCWYSTLEHAEMSWDRRIENIDRAAARGDIGRT